jgi:Asp-tRNA(Asn)/Glu-tRNA(Gln) amidotransferase A subunit family amidase
VFGFKPTFGALNRGGISDQFSQNCLGTLSATLEDGWAVCHAIGRFAGGDPGFPPFSGGPLPAPPRRPATLAVLQTAGWAVADPAAIAAFYSFMPRLSAAGIALLDRTTSPRVAQLEAAIAEAATVSQQINNWEKLWPLAELDSRHSDQISPKLRDGIAAGRAMTPDDYRILLHRRDEMRRLLVALADEVDACITLAAPGPAPLGLGSTGNAIFNVPASALRTPAISLPLLTVDGMPLGVQLIGFPHRDRALSGLAAYLGESGTQGA